MANIIPTSFKTDLASGNIDLDSDTFYVMLLTSSATPAASWNRRDDVTNEVTGTGYTAGGQALTTLSVTAVGTQGKWTADPTTWASSTITARYAVIYKHRGGASSADELVLIVDFGADKSSSGGNFTITWDATNGILLIG
jgi:hypothetical protein